MTLSYYITHELILFNDDGSQREIKKQEVDFMKMVAKAFEMNCNLKMAVYADRKIWVLEPKNNNGTPLNITDMQIATPFHDRILVLPDKAEEEIGGYKIPDDAQKAPKRGKIIAVGPGIHAEDTGALIPNDAKVGDTILYSKFGGTEVELDGVVHVVLKPNECLLIL